MIVEYITAAMHHTLLRDHRGRRTLLRRGPRTAGSLGHRHDAWGVPGTSGRGQSTV